MTTPPALRRPLLSGPPPALPAVLDRIAEAWWSAPPRARWAAAGLLLVVLVGAALGHAAATPYGPPTTVLVAVTDLRPGDTLGPGDLRRRTVPADLVPAGALTEAHGVLAAALPAGAIATDRHLGDGGWAAGLPADRAAVAVTGEQLPHLTPGTRVDLVGADHDGRATVLGPGAVVLAAEMDTVWFAVAATDAVAVTGAAAVGALAVVVLPP